MLPRPLASLVVLALALAACHRSPLRPGVVRFTPRAEDDRVGPVGVGDARCELYVYAWARDGRCRYQLNHCSVDPHSASSVVCLTLADEHTLACGARENACGQTVECECPRGAPAPVAEAPGTLHVTPTEYGRSLASADGRCTARVATLPGGGSGPPPAPCIFALHDCADGPCMDRTVMLSCSVRGDVCGQPVQCVCPDAPAPR